MIIRKSVLWQLLPQISLLFLLTVGTLTFFAIRELHNTTTELASADLDTISKLLSSELSQAVATADTVQAQSIVSAFAASPILQITVVDLNYRLLTDSKFHEELSGQEYRHVDFDSALQGKSYTDQRYSDILKQQVILVASPIKVADRIAGAIRIIRSAQEIEAGSGRLLRVFLIYLFVVLSLAAALLYYFRRQFQAVIAYFQQMAERFVEGNFRSRAALPDSLEFANLAGSLNRMARASREQIRRIEDQKVQLDGVLQSMVEGVVAFDRAEQIILINNAAIELFEVRNLPCEGKQITDVIRNSHVYDAAREILATRRNLVKEIFIGIDMNVFVELRGSQLKDINGAIVGGVFIFHDVTELRRLENIRKDFVANVSHELRTPITSIKGAVESLITGAAENLDSRGRFIEMIQRHTDRLGLIVEDLLNLSRIEQQEEHGKLELVQAGLRSVLEAALQACSQKALERNINLKLICAEEISVNVSRHLIEQAVINLIDNAIKYSNDGGNIEISGRLDTAEVQILVQDWGCGIATEHHERLFERFYRADKARSRKVGGTGLGLAIVKHIAQLHGGYTTLHSELGRGSTFGIHLPLIPSQSI